MITIKVNGESRQYEKGISFEDIVKEYQEEYKNTIVLVVEDGKIKELNKKAKKDQAELTFITLRDKIGHTTYTRSASLLLVKAVNDVMGNLEDAKIKIEFSIGQGYYCSIKGNFQADASMVAKIKARMWEIVDADLPITKQAYPKDEARSIFEAQGMEDKQKLFWYRRSSYVNLYCLDGYYEYNYGYMVPSTGYLCAFDLIPYEEGLMLLLPSQQEPGVIKEFVPREKLFATLKKSTLWAEGIGINTVGDLNEIICEGKLSDVILMQEAMQERRIAEIASEIADRGNVKFVMIAGPSSSGKTTFSHRLSIQLRTHGLKPHPIAVDDYFVNREKTPETKTEITILSVWKPLM